MCHRPPALRHQQEVNTKITFNQRQDATSLITKKVACVWSLVFQAPPITFYFDFKCGRGGQTTTGKRDLETVQLDTTRLASQWSVTEVSRTWVWELLSKTRIKAWTIYSGHPLNQRWINNPVGCCLPQCVPAPSHTSSVTLAWEFPDLLQRWLLLTHLWPPPGPVHDWCSVNSFGLTKVTPEFYHMSGSWQQGRLLH